MARKEDDARCQALEEKCSPRFFVLQRIRGWGVGPQLLLEANEEIKPIVNASGLIRRISTTYSTLLEPLETGIRNRGSWRGLTRGEVAEKALQIGDREGLEAVSFRRLAAELGVTPMAVHHHVSDRDGLHTAMLAALMDDFDVLEGVDAELPWPERLRAALLSVHDFSRHHPVMAQLLVTSAPRPSAVFRTPERLIGLLLEAGFQPQAAVEITRVVIQQQEGLLLLEAAAARTNGSSDTAARRAELRLLELPPDQFPNILTFAQQISRLDLDRWRDLATDIIVRGVVALLPSPP
jgi:TetR/AcrR family tetracycline transcriptional repressor